MVSSRFTSTQLAARAAYLLRGNDLGIMTSAAPKLYPHMWSWDAAFVSIGLAPLSINRAVLELDTLLSAQWKNGMIPHIVFAEDADGYFPGASRWQCSQLSDNPPGKPETSGICQPPVHAIALQRIVDHSRRRGRTARKIVEDFIDFRWNNFMAWHRWLATARDPLGNGLVTIYHGWESGMDNSPRWDKAYSRVIPGGDLPPFEREDNTVIPDPTQRPSDREYDRYMWLVEQMKRAHYDDEILAKVMDFAVQDVFISAILSLSCGVLANIGDDFHQSRNDIAELLELSARFREGVLTMSDPHTGIAYDNDLHASKNELAVKIETIASYSALLCGGLPREIQRALLSHFDGPQFCGHPEFKYAVLPSTSPVSLHFKSREYWRGPSWPVTTWLFSWAFAQHGWVERSLHLREEGIKQVSDGTFAEYYEPFTGEPLGSMQQSWTAAAVLDWLG